MRRRRVDGREWPRAHTQLCCSGGLHAKLSLCVNTLAHLPVPRASFKQALAQGDRDVLHGVLKWVLAQGQQLEKRAFVGFYLSWPEVRPGQAELSHYQLR
jgi:hypothetical protein